MFLHIVAAVIFVAESFHTRNTPFFVLKHFYLCDAMVAQVLAMGLFLSVFVSSHVNILSNSCKY